MLKRNKNIIQIILANMLIVVNTVAIIPIQVFAATPSKQILNMPEVNVPTDSTLTAGDDTTTTQSEDTLEFKGKTSPIEGTSTGTISIPGIGTGSITTDIVTKPIDVNITREKNKERVYSLVVNNIFNSNGTYLNIPKELISSSILKEINSADIVEWRNFEPTGGSTITYNPLMSDEYKRALSWLSTNNIIHPFPEYTLTKDGNNIKQSTDLVTSPYQNYTNINGEMRSAAVTKADFVMTLMKAVDGVQWSRPLAVKSEETGVNQLEPILDSIYRKDFLTKIGNIDVSENSITLDRSKYQMQSIYMNPNVYELYFTAALNNGILDVTDFSTSNQFIYDYIGWQTFRTQANSDGSLKDSGLNDKDTATSYGKAYPRWLVRNQLMRLDNSNPSSIKINYIPGSKPFGESYTYGPNNIYLGNSIKEQINLANVDEPNIITQYLSFSSADKSFSDKYKDLVNQMPALYRLTQEDTSAFDSNSMRELAIKYNPDIAKTYFNVNNITYMDAFNILYKALKNYDSVKLTNLETEVITSKFGLRFKDLSDDNKTTVNYLVAKGIINPEEYDSYILDSTLTQEDAYILLYRLCNKDARYKTDFSISQAALDMVKQGYVQSSVKMYKVSPSTSDVSVQVNSDAENTQNNGYFPLYVTTENSSKIKGYLTDKNDNKLTVAYTPITTVNKNNFVVFLVPNNYLNQDLRISIETDSGTRVLTGLKGSGIYTIPTTSSNSNKLDKYSLIADPSSPSKVVDIRNHILQNKSIVSNTGTPEDDTSKSEIVLNTGVILTNGLHSYKYSSGTATECSPSSIADTSSNSYVAFIGDISNIKELRKGDTVIKTNKIVYSDDNRLYLNLDNDMSNMDLTLVLNDGTEIPFTNNSLFYKIQDKSILPVNIANYYNYASDASESQIESDIKTAYKSILKVDSSVRGMTLDYILNTKYNFSKISETTLKLKTSILDLFSSITPSTERTFKYKVENYKLSAPNITTDVSLGFNRSSLDAYRFQDTKIFVDSKINTEFISDLTKIVSDITISDDSTLDNASTSQIRISFKTKQRSAESLLSTLMNKITIVGDLTTESKVAFVSIMAGQDDNRKGVLIPESELGKYNLEVVLDKDNRKNTLRNKATGVTAYLNQSLNKAIIGNEIHNYGETALLYSTTDGVNYYNLSVIAELMAIDSLSSTITSEGIIVPYKNSGYTGTLVPASVGTALATQTQAQIDSNEYSLMNDNVAIGGSKYIDNGRKIQVITAYDGVYADLTSLSDSSNGYMIARHPFNNVRRLVVGYELDRAIDVSDIGAESNISSTLNTYINDIKKTPVRTLSSNIAVQRAKDNLVINNTIAHAFIQPESSWSINPLTTEYLTKPIINLIVYPGVSKEDMYNKFIDLLVQYHNQERSYTFLGSTIKIPISGDIASWYKSKIKLDDPNSDIRLNIIETTYKDGVVPSNSDIASLISTDGKWLVTSSGNTMIKVGSEFTDTNCIRELGFKMNYINNKMYVTNPYIYEGLPTNTIPLEDLVPGTTVRLPSGAKYTTIDPISTISYRGTTNVLYTDMAVSLISKTLTKATKIVRGMDEIDIWNDFYKGIREQADIDTQGINSNYISDPWKTDLGSSTDLSDKNLAYRQTLTLLNEAYATSNKTDFTVRTNTDNSSLKGPIAYPFMTDKTSMNKISYLYSNTNISDSEQDYVDFSSDKKEVTNLDKIDNNVVLLSRVPIRVKYGTAIVDAVSRDATDNSYVYKQFNSGSRYVQKLFIDSPLSELRNYLYNEAANVSYIKDIPSGAKINTNAGIFIKVNSNSSDSTEYVTFISATPQDVDGDTLRNSLTPVALKTAKLLASTQLNGDLGLKIPLLNLADLNSFVPPTKEELESVLGSVDQSKKEYTTVYVDNYNDTDVSLKMGNISGATLTETDKVSSNVKTYPRFDLNPYLKVIQVGDSKNDNYQILGYDNKGSHATNYSLNNYAYLFKFREDSTEPLTLWEEFTGLELANLRIKDRSLYDPMFQENLLAVEANSSVVRAESIGYRIKVLMYALIISYIICMLAMLPLVTIPSIRYTLRSRGGTLFLKVISLGRVQNVDEIVFKEYYPQLIFVLFITVMLFNTSFNLSFLNVIGDITYKVVSILYENIKLVINSIYA